MAIRYRHDFGLLEESHKNSIRVTMEQLWEEVVGIGFYQYPDPVPPALCPDSAALGLWDLYAKEASAKEISELSPKQAFMIGVSMAYAHYRYRWPKT